MRIDGLKRLAVFAIAAFALFMAGVVAVDLAQFAVDSSDYPLGWGTFRYRSEATYLGQGGVELLLLVTGVVAIFRARNSRVTALGLLSIVAAFGLMLVPLWIAQFQHCA